MTLQSDRLLYLLEFCFGCLFSMQANQHLVRALIPPLRNQPAGTRQDPAAAA